MEEGNIKTPVAARGSNKIIVKSFSQLMASSQRYINGMA
jgi:hypothetical protein